jgi:uncharacterized membrane protein
MPRWTDRHVDNVMGILLRAGVMLAAFTVLAGAVWHLSSHAGDLADYHTFRAEPASLRSVSGIVTGALALHGVNIIQLGLLFLIATPIARVLFAIFAFAMQRDRAYVVISIIVLAILAYSLTGHGEV